jgi:peptidoglycan/LPS O-acetylase OafA/YrhL
VIAFVSFMVRLAYPARSQQILDLHLWQWPQCTYAAYMLQVPVLIGLEIAVRPLPLPAAVKMVPVAALAVVACFALGWVIVDRTRLGRIL